MGNFFGFNFVSNDNIELLTPEKLERQYQQAEKEFINNWKKEIEIDLLERDIREMVIEENKIGNKRLVICSKPYNHGVGKAKQFHPVNTTRLTYEELQKKHKEILEVLLLEP